MKKHLLTFAIGASLISASIPLQVIAQDRSANEKIIQNYATMVHQDYKRTYEDALKLQSNIIAFLDNPTRETMDEAKKAWLESRNSYSQTEAFRFYEGPIDFADADGNEGPEGRLNAWPMDEAYIDYVQGNPNTGLVNNDGEEITIATLMNKNQADDEADVATGYHAIEFLLWGQDLSLESAGQRPVSDYTKTSDNERRRTYLKLVTDLLVNDLQTLVKAWAPDQDNYAKDFIRDDDALANIIKALATLSGFELAAERMATALDSGDQEDEQSCFSDNTHNDFIHNQQGIMNVFFNTALYEELKKKDEELAENLKEQILESKKLLESLPHPIDREILNTPKHSASRMQMEKAITSLQQQADLFKKAGNAFDIEASINE